MNWPVFILVVPKIGRKFLVGAPNEEQATVTAAWHAAIVMALAEERRKEGRS